VKLQGIHRLENDVKHYDWGSHTSIPELLGLPVPSEKPWAEMWMGAYPGSASRVWVAGGTTPLDAFIAADPEAVLGRRGFERFGPKLPFLFKVLAAAKPLSIQAHPSLEQAREGYLRENEMGLSPGAATRNYRDANHKPELLCALTPFVALDRFRPVADVVAGLAEIGAPELEGPLARLRTGKGGAALREGFGALMGLERERAQALLERATTAARTATSPAFACFTRLAEAHPLDIGALAPFFLNIVELDPGQAVFVPAGELHSYIEGTAIELMANSDNVLRGGLTTKHVDLPELLNTLDFESRAPEVLSPVQGAPGEARFESPAEEFSLSRLEVRSDRDYGPGGGQRLEILICTDGTCALLSGAEGDALRLERGSVVLVTATASPYVIRGAATLYRASAGPR
jgi:mannose-6-phosphate isomerase